MRVTIFRQIFPFRTWFTIRTTKVGLRLQSTDLTIKHCTYCLLRFCIELKNKIQKSITLEISVGYRRIAITILHVYFFIFSFFFFFFGTILFLRPISTNRTAARARAYRRGIILLLRVVIYVPEYSVGGKEKKKNNNKRPRYAS